MDHDCDFSKTDAFVSHLRGLDNESAQTVYQTVCPSFLFQLISPHEKSETLRYDQPKNKESTLLTNATLPAKLKKRIESISYTNVPMRR